jgi:hypothetical protein
MSDSRLLKVQVESPKYLQQTSPKKQQLHTTTCGHDLPDIIIAFFGFPSGSGRSIGLRIAKQLHAPAGCGCRATSLTWLLVISREKTNST